VLSDIDLEVRCCMELGIQIRRAGRFAEAQEQMLAAHRLRTEAKHPVLPSTENNLAMVCCAAGHFDEAARWADQALRDCPSDALSWRAAILHILGRAYFGSGDLQVAKHYLDQAHGVLRHERDNIHHTILLYHDLGRLTGRRGQPGDAIAMLHQGLDLVRELDEVDLEADLHGELQTQYLAIGALVTALEHCSYRTDALIRRARQSTQSGQDFFLALNKITALQARWSDNPFARGD
jgi:tetratricopeptide (TPR) repeat protein